MTKESANIANAIRILEDHITEQGMRKTPERRAILETVMKMEGHHSADEVLEMMPKDFHVSRTTVYTALKMFDELGLVFSHSIRGVTLYETAYGRTAHHHYICRGCNKIWDFRNEEVERAAATCRTPRFKKIRATIYIQGLCNACQVRLSRLKKKMEKQKSESMTREERRFARISEELAEAAEWFKE